MISLANSRVIGISWRNFIDRREYPWIRTKKIISGMKAEPWRKQTTFHIVCENGQKSIAEMIMRNSDDLSIDLNATDFFW